MLLETIRTIFTPENLLMMNVGLAAGIIIGALPGLNVVFAIAVLLPITFGMGSVAGMYLLLGAYCGAVFGGSISAVLINTPGTPAACATVLDGYPMASSGRAGDALKVALSGSFIGGVLSCAALLLFAPQLAKVALYIGAPEYFALCVFGLSAVVGLAGDKVVKGVIMAALGLLLSCVGIDSVNGSSRFMFGNMQLLAGLKPATVMLGVFALSEVFAKCRQSFSGDTAGESVVFQKATIRLKEILRYWKTLIKSSIIGIVIGAVPGTGSGIAAMLSYNEAQRKSKTPEEFGTGCVEGILAPETANNAITGATLIPLLTLGIPGDGAVAVLLGALTMQGITPGLSLFSGENIWVYAIMGGLLLINIFMVLQGSVFIKGFANITRVPMVVLLPCITILSVVGSFAISNASFDVMLMIGFGLFGFILKCLDFPIAPLTISLVLGSLMETNLRRSLILSQGSGLIFLTRPISLIILLVSAVSLISPVLRQAKGRAGK